MNTILHPEILKVSANKFADRKIKCDPACQPAVDECEPHPPQKKPLYLNNESKSLLLAPKKHECDPSCGPDYGCSPDNSCGPDNCQP